jgi:sulfite exporter TauE/SafE
MTYVLLGFAAGATGMSAVALGAGRALTWIAAAGLIVQAIRSTRKSATTGRSFITRHLRSFAAGFAGMSGTYPVAGAVSMGAVNGLLPCGLVYSAALTAMGWGDALTGAMFMAGFAAGTTLVLAAAGVIWIWLSARLPRFAQRLTPVALVLIAILLVLRAGPAAHVH